MSIIINEVKEKITAIKFKEENLKDINYTLKTIEKEGSPFSFIYLHPCFRVHNDLWTSYHKTTWEESYVLTTNGGNTFGIKENEYIIIRIRDDGDNDVRVCNEYTYNKKYIEVSSTHEVV